MRSGCLSGHTLLSRFHTPETGSSSRARPSGCTGRTDPGHEQGPGPRPRTRACRRRLCVAARSSLSASATAACTPAAAVDPMVCGKEGVASESGPLRGEAWAARPRGSSRTVRRSSCWRAAAPRASASRACRCPSGSCGTAPSRPSESCPGIPTLEVPGASGDGSYGACERRRPRREGDVKGQRRDGERQRAHHTSCSAPKPRGADICLSLDS